MRKEKGARGDAVEAARLGAMLAGKGLTPDQVETVVREQVEPVLAEATRLVENGTPVDEIQFVIKHRGRS